MKNIEIVSLEPTSMGKDLVVTYKTTSGTKDTEMIVAIDYNKVIIKFRNLMIEQTKKNCPQTSAG